MVEIYYSLYRRIRSKGSQYFLKFSFIGIKTGIIYKTIFFMNYK